MDATCWKACSSVLFSTWTRTVRNGCTVDRFQRICCTRVLAASEARAQRQSALLSPPPSPSQSRPQNCALAHSGPVHIPRPAQPRFLLPLGQPTATLLLPLLFLSGVQRASPDSEPKGRSSWRMSAAVHPKIRPPCRRASGPPISPSDRSTPARSDSSKNLSVNRSSLPPADQCRG